jgi:sugar lactone lactonase YvrE
MAQRHGLAFLHLQTGKTSLLIPIEADMTDNRFNDGKCDRQGRFWFGSMCPGKN